MGEHTFDILHKFTYLNYFISIKPKIQGSKIRKWSKKIAQYSRIKKRPKIAHPCATYVYRKYGSVVTHHEKANSTSL